MRLNCEFKKRNKNHKIFMEMVKKSKLYEQYKKNNDYTILIGILHEIIPDEIMYKLY